MLELLTTTHTEEFLSFCNRHIEGAVIFTRLKAYGTDSNEALFWFSRNDTGSINAVCSMTDGIFTYCADDSADKEEILMFASIMGAGQITQREKYLLRFCNSEENCSAENITSENIKQTFPVIYENEAKQSAIFPYWYTDASHKIRHSLIHGKGIFIDGKCVSVALTSGESDTMAVISSVATLTGYRKKGYGRSVVLALAKELDKDIYLMTDNPETSRWYESMGFELL